MVDTPATMRDVRSLREDIVASREEHRAELQAIAASQSLQTDMLRAISTEVLELRIRVSRATPPPLPAPAPPWGRRLAFAAVLLLAALSAGAVGGCAVQRAAAQVAP